MGITDARWTIRKFDFELEKIIPEFRNINHDTTYRLPVGKPFKVWYDTRFKLEEFKAFEQEVLKSKKA